MPNAHLFGTLQVSAGRALVKWIPDRSRLMLRPAIVLQTCKAHCFMRHHR